MTGCEYRMQNGLLCERPFGHSDAHWAPEAESKLSDIGHTMNLVALGSQVERGIRSLELIADALQTLAKVESERQRMEVESAKKLSEMNERIRHGAVINRASDEKREQFSDKASESWLRETEAAIPKSRFEERLESERKRAETAVKK